MTEGFHAQCQWQICDSMLEGFGRDLVWSIRSAKQFQSRLLSSDGEKGVGLWLGGTTWRSAAPSSPAPAPVSIIIIILSLRFRKIFPLGLLLSRMNIKPGGLRADLSELRGQLPHPSRCQPTGALPQHFGEWGGALLLEFARKERSDDHDTVSQTTNYRARAVQLSNAPAQPPSGAPRRHCPFGENCGGGRGGSIRRRHPRQERRRPRLAGHSCFCHSPARSPTPTTRHEEDKSRKNNNNDGSESDFSLMK